MDTAEEKVSKLEDMLIETSKTKIQRENLWKNIKRLSKNSKIITKL